MTTFNFVLFFIPFFLCWGSFLNVVAYRLLQGISIIKPRSRCIHCKHTIAWYDLIPLFSWLWLRTKCRHCTMPISFLYPFIELLTAITMSMLLSLIDMHYFFAYFIFFSALIITIRTDLETMMISRFMTLFLVPFGILCSMLGLLPISPVESIIGALLGYSILYCIAFLFYRRTGKEGIGQGDLDLLSFIGSCTGIYGCWISLLIGSVLGSLVGIIYILISKANKKNIKIPFGPFLSLGAICFVLYQHQLLKSILRI